MAKGVIDNKELVYYLYHTGTDNYRYEFKIIENQDTTDLFISYLNDATAKNSTFIINEENKKINIKSNKSLGRQKNEALGGTFILEGIN